MFDPYWNHNVHHHPEVLDAVPDGCGKALDAGCGDGLLTRKRSRRRSPASPGSPRPAAVW
ncbi:hypothetical protein ABZ935_18625 [Streptomyces coeruleorubidus]|uniref:hypothetical protein n=1 Tax=Streptomyces coeruleorubidus TaxID=116188 RepID=UPI0033F298ED